MAVELKKPSTFQQYKTLLRKDLEQEFRTKEMLTSMGIYALLVIIVYGAALAQTSQTTDVLQMSGGLLWALIVFTSLLGLNRSWAPSAWRASARCCPPSPSTRAART